MSDAASCFDGLSMRWLGALRPKPEDMGNGLTLSMPKGEPGARAPVAKPRARPSSSFDQPYGSNTGALARQARASLETRLLAARLAILPGYSLGAVAAMDGRLENLSYQAASFGRFSRQRSGAKRKSR